MLNGPDAHIIDVMTEASHRLAVAVDMLDCESNGDIEAHGGWASQVIEEIIRDVSATMSATVKAKSREAEKARRAQKKGGA